MKIVFFGVEKADQEVFQKSLKGAEVSFFDEKLDENNADKFKNAEAVCIFVDSTINKKVIDSLPNLKFIATRSTGFNHIDCEYAKGKGIQVSTVPAYGSHTVAEFTFGLILNLSRNIIKANNYLRQSSDFNFFAGMEGFDLSGKTLGVIGTGRIGKNVIKIAQGFGMKIIACDIYPDEEFSKEHDFEYKDLLQVLGESDIVTLHVPYTPESHHLINKENVAVMKKGAYLINSARGELVETEALVSGLKEGIIGAAGLDVLEEEKNLKKGEKTQICDWNRELMKMDNVLITPHSAFYTVEAVDEILKVTIDNIKSFIAGKPEN